MPGSPKLTFIRSVSQRELLQTTSTTLKKQVKYIYFCKYILLFSPSLLSKWWRGHIHLMLLKHIRPQWVDLVI